MNLLPLLAVGTIAPLAVQEITPDSRRGYYLKIRAAEGTTIRLDHLRLQARRLGRSPFRWERTTAPAPEWGPEVAPFREENTVRVPASGEVELWFREFPRELLGAQGIRVSLPGSRFAVESRLVTPEILPLPPEAVAGQRFLGAPARTVPWLSFPDSPEVPLEKRVFRTITLRRLVEGRWEADLEGAGAVRVESHPLDARGLIPLLREPQAARYEGRSFWAHPHAIEAFSDSGRVRGTAILDRRKVRVKSLYRFWPAGPVVISGSPWTNDDPMGRAGLWPALHPLLAIIEPLDADPIRITSPRAAIADLPIPPAEAIAFARHMAGRRYVVFAADLWDLDRKLSAQNPASTLGVSPPEIRQAIGQAIGRAQPIAGMTPAQVAWAIGWPNDPTSRASLERFRDGTWEYPRPFGWTAVEFRDGRVVRTTDGP